MNKDIFPITKNNHVIFFKDGDLYYEKYLQAIRSAQVSIHLQTYIFELDSFGTQVQKELIAASERGIRVHLLVDSIGSRNLSLEAEELFKKSKITFCRFNSIRLKWFYHWGRRLHHKILLIDEKEGFVGGINVLRPSLPGSNIPQLDFAVYINGPATIELAYYCKVIFKKACKRYLPVQMNNEFIHNQEGYEIGISVNDWIHGRSKITKQYSEKTIGAKKQITIINSYFFPRKKFMAQLTAAAARGVRVRLILPRYSDWPSYILASEYLYYFFLKGGVEIYQWNKSVLHGKLATVDNNWSTIGSFNLNYTSYQQNLEMNVDIYSSDFTEYLNQEIEKIIHEGCDKLELEQFHEKSSFKIRFLRLFFYLILSIIANFSIGLTFKEDHVREHRVYHVLRIIGALVCFFLGVAGVLLPIIPGFPFFILSFLLVYKQILTGKKEA